MVKDSFGKRFGTIAVSKGFTTKEQLFEALKIQVEEDLEEMEHRLIGTVLYGLGYMTQEQIIEVIDESSNY